MYPKGNNVFSQCYNLIASMDETKANDILTLLQNINSNDGIQILWGSHEQIFASIPHTLLKVMEYDDNIGPKNKYILNETPFKIPITKIVDDYVLKNAEKFNEVPESYVLKKNDEVLIRCGDKVVFEGYIFYAKYNGSVSYLYVSDADLKLDIDDSDEEIDTQISNDISDEEMDTQNPNNISEKKQKIKINKYVAITKSLQKFVLIKDLERELKMCEEQHNFWAKSANWS